MLQAKAGGNYYSSIPPPPPPPPHILFTLCLPGSYNFIFSTFSSFSAFPIHSASFSPRFSSLSAFPVHSTSFFPDSPHSLPSRFIQIFSSSPDSLHSLPPRFIQLHFFSSDSHRTERKAACGVTLNPTVTCERLNCVLTSRDRGSLAGR